MEILCHVRKKERVERVREEERVKIDETRATSYKELRRKSSNIAALAIVPWFCVPCVAVLAGRYGGGGRAALPREHVRRAGRMLIA